MPGSIVLEPAEQNAFGDKTDPGAQAGLVVKANLVTDLLAQPDTALPRYAGGHRAGRHPARLKHDDFPGGPSRSFGS